MAVEIKHEIEKWVEQAIQVQAVMDILDDPYEILEQICEGYGSSPSSFTTKLGGYEIQAYDESGKYNTDDATLTQELKEYKEYLDAQLFKYESILKDMKAKVKLFQQNLEEE